MYNIICEMNRQPRFDVGYSMLGSSQCTSPKLPVFCIEPGLAIHFLYDIIHVLMPFSQIIPAPRPISHRVQKTVLYISVSFAVSHTGLLLPSFQIPYICVSILYWCFSFWLTSLCINRTAIRPSNPTAGYTH